MADVNEELVRRYFEVQGYFVRSNVRYRYQAEKGTGWSDIDLCVLNPVSGDLAAVEIKGWHTESITPSYLRDWPSLFYFTRPEATDAVTKLLGTNKFRRVLVISRVGQRGREEVMDYAAQRGVEILEFADVLRLLIEKTPVNLEAGSESEHVIRVLKTYDLIRSS